MKALVYTATKRPSTATRPPDPRPGRALVGIDAVGICGSDMHAWHGHDPRRVPPLILGHEACGTVMEETERRRTGLQPLISCGLRLLPERARQSLRGARTDRHAPARRLRRADRNPGAQPDPGAGGHGPGKGRPDRALRDRLARFGTGARAAGGRLPRAAPWSSAAVRSGCSRLDPRGLGRAECAPGRDQSPAPTDGQSPPAWTSSIRSPTGEAADFDLVFDAVGATATARPRSPPCALAAPSPMSACRIGPVISMPAPDPVGDRVSRRLHLYRRRPAGLARRAARRLPGHARLDRASGRWPRAARPSAISTPAAAGRQDRSQTLKKRRRNKMERKKP